MSDDLQHRCNRDGSLIFKWLEAGMEYQCRRCKQRETVAWEEILKQSTIARASLIKPSESHPSEEKVRSSERG